LIGPSSRFLRWALRRPRPEISITQGTTKYLQTTLKPGKYESAILEIFNENYREGLDRLDVPMDVFREVCQRHGIANHPDLYYYYAKGRGQLPEEIRGKGFLSLGIIEGGYCFSKESQFVTLPDVRFEERRVELPEPVFRFLRDDEQSHISLIGYAGIMTEFLGKPAFRVQSHAKSGETEIDDIYATMEEEIVAIEVVGVVEQVNRDQIRRQAETARRIFNAKVISLAVKFIDDSKCIVMMFDSALNVVKSQGYTLTKVPKGQTSISHF